MTNEFYTKLKNALKVDGEAFWVYEGADSIGEQKRLRAVLSPVFPCDDITLTLGWVNDRKGYYIKLAPRHRESCKGSK